MARRSSGRGANDLVYAEVDDRALFMRLRGLDRELSKQLRKDNLRLSKRAAVEISDELLNQHMAPPQTRLLAESAKGKSDRVIVVQLGGTKRVGWKYAGSRNGERQYRKRGGAPAGLLLYGARSGSVPAGKSRGLRFVRPHRSNGYWPADLGREAALMVLGEWRRIAASYLDRIS